MKTSVIIPAYSVDRIDDIFNAVESIIPQTLLPDEIIISVDHNQKLVDMLNDYYKLNKDIRVVLNDKVIGGAETRNVGIWESNGEILAFLDDDAVADEKWLEYLLEQYERLEVMAVGGKTISVWDNGRPRWFPEELDWIVGGIWKGHPTEECEVRNLIGPNMSFRKSVCDTIGYMRSELGAMPQKARAGDETEFYMRLKHYIPDGKIIYEPKAIVYHKVYPYKSTLRSVLRRSYSDGYFKSKTKNIYKNSKHKPFKTEYTFLRYLLTKAVPLKVLAFYKKGSLSQAIVILLSITAVGLGYIRGIIERGREEVST